MAEAKLKSRKSVRRKHWGAGRPAASEVTGRMENLLDTATAVFLEYGYENANVSEIARRAGASKRTIYSRYPTKAELFVAVVTRKTVELQVTYAETLVPLDSLKSVLEGYGVRLLRGMWNPELRSLYRVFIAASPKFQKLADRFWDVGPKRSMAMLRDYLAEHSEFRGKHPEHAAEMFWSLCCGQSVLRALLHEGDHMSEEAFRLKVKEATRIFFAAYT